MKQLSEFLVKFRWIFLAISVIFAIVSGFLIFHVKLNYDLSAYLPNDSIVAIGMDNMTEAFGDETTSRIKVMMEGLTVEEQETVFNQLKQTVSNETVFYDDSALYHEGDYTLYVVEVNDDAHSTVAKDTYEAVKELLKDKQVYYGGDIPDAQSNYLITLIAWAAGLLFVVLFLLGRSWFEPLVYLVTLGIAVLLNYGTNVILPQISDITFTIAAVLQLVLSIDYSIMLSERYRQERLEGNEPIEAMKLAIQKGMRSITASSLTTILGLLCLLMMSFTIGMDIGIVLAKGILFSYLMTLTVLPSLLIGFDAIIKKSEKKWSSIKSSSLAKGWMRLSIFQKRFRWIITAVFLALVVTGVYYNQKVEIDFFLPSNAKDAQLVEEHFPTHEQIVLLYETTEEANVASLIEDLEVLEGTASVVAYANTLNFPLTKNELSQQFSMDPLIIDAIFHHYHNRLISPLSLHQFSDFIASTLAVNAGFSTFFDESTLQKIQFLNQMTTLEVITASYDALGLSTLLSMDEATVENLILLYYSENGEVPEETVVLHEFVDFLVILTTHPTYGALFSSDDAALLHQLAFLMTSTLDETVYTSEICYTLMAADDPSWTQETVDLIYLLYFSHEYPVETDRLSIEAFIQFLATTVRVDDVFSNLINEDMQAIITTSYQQVMASKDELVSTTYSRIIITTPYTLQDEQTMPYLKSMHETIDDYGIDMDLIGQLAMAYEMNQTFLEEYNFITILSIAVIFVLIALSFQSIVIPVILVTLIQTSIYLTMSLNRLFQSSLYFLAIILVQAILIGAAIDYAILFSNYYRDLRKTHEVGEALSLSYQGASPAILTSSVVLVVIASLLSLIVSSAMISAILKTLAIGFTISIILTLFFLPGLLTLFDKAVCWVWKRRKPS